MDKERRAAWETAIDRKDRGEEVPPEDHYALLRKEMFNEGSKDDTNKDAYYFLRYWLHGIDLSAIGYRGEGIGEQWFFLGDWDRKYGKNRSDEALQNYIKASEYDYDYFVALHTIASRLHREHRQFPKILSDWAAELHEKLCKGTHKPPSRDIAHKGQPRYANENRNLQLYAADSWLEHFGMKLKKDRLAAIAGYTKLDEDTVRKSIQKVRKIFGDQNRNPTNFLPWKCLPLPKKL